ncbi:MAG: class I SAM-dependent methyltransferase [Anaerolineales bacterium]
MNLIDIIRRQPQPAPWAEGEKIPWNDPEFSQRMLKEHLSQEHDAASRVFEIIDGQVQWIHEHVLAGKPTRILDLGCGPGLYTSRLARLGHKCVGIDFSPASIAYAKQQAQESGLDCAYHLQDIREAEFGEGYGLVMLIYGEFNVFRPEVAREILTRIHRALKPDGYLLLEPHTYEVVVDMGAQPAFWYTAENGLFSDQPYLYLEESMWDGDSQTTIKRYYVIDAVTSEVTRHPETMQAYTDDQYLSTLRTCGFGQVSLEPSFDGQIWTASTGLMAILAQKASAAS